jgi:mannosyltransferase OCH1-like enzyme
MQKIIHQIWLGTKPIPAAFHAYMRSWKLHFPGWAYKLWTDADLPTLRPNLLSGLAFQRGLNVGLCSDILRLEVLRIYGGIYADVDFEALSNFEGLLKPNCFHYGDELAFRPSNAWLACPRGHGFPELMLRAIDRHLSDSVARGGPWDSVQELTGPAALHRALQAWVWRWHCAETIFDWQARDVGGRYGDVVVFKTALLYPYWFESREDWQRALEHGQVAARFPLAVAAHHWGGSWQ